MSRLNTTTIFSHILREYDDQPQWNIHIHDDTGHPVTIKDIGTVTLRKHNNYHYKEITILYYKKRGGAYGESYMYTENIGEHLSMEDIIFENNNTGKRYTVKEYEEYLRTHPLREGGVLTV